MVAKPRTVVTFGLVSDRGGRGRRKSQQGDPVIPRGPEVETLSKALITLFRLKTVAGLKEVLGWEGLGRSAAGPGRP